MGALKQRAVVDTKHKLSNTLRNWLPILHSSLSDLNDAMMPFVESNPVIEVESGFEEEFEKKIPKKIISGNISNSRTQQIEALTIQKKSLYEILDEQIGKPLFPTPISQEVAQFIVENLDENGYYEGDTLAFCEARCISVDEFEKIRLRFAHVEPVGVGAKDLSECFAFQLDASDISDEAYGLCLKIIKDIESIYDYANEENFSEVMRVLG